jgi:two-component system response regulator AtoC
MQEVYKMIGRLARTDATVLLWGESGTGKELVAKKIHEHSSRRDSAMVAINCAAIPESLIESELFGHEKDAFTGAAARKKGLFEVADGSTLFLDEVGELSLPIQAKLLRFFQEREIYRVGGKEPVQLDVRIVAATNLDLEEALKRGTFREDLYYRLNVIRLNLPPLRARRQDIPLLVEHFLGKFRSELANPYLHVTQETMDVLLAYTWPGNVRELENTLREAGLKAKGGKITPLELSIPPYTLDLEPEASGTGQEEPFKSSLERFLMKNPGTAFDRLEEATVRRALEISKGNQVKAAQLLGITRNVLRHRIKRYRILDA